MTVVAELSVFLAGGHLDLTNIPTNSKNISSVVTSVHQLYLQNVPRLFAVKVAVCGCYYMLFLVSDQKSETTPKLQ